MLRLIGWLFGFAMFMAVAGIAVGAVYLSSISAGLPDYTVLKDYQPPVTTRVHAADGSLLGEYARERRIFQPIETIPPLVIEAFLSAEDKDFFKHPGIDFAGVVRAVRDNVMQRIEGSSGPLVGASTITQQVAKNFLLSSEQTWDRKIVEAILALRIESTFSKDKILELYLNEIYLGSVGGQSVRSVGRPMASQPPRSTISTRRSTS
jgi:penicillin-binding protein 1A